MKQKENRDRIIAIAALAIGLVATLLISSAVSFAETCGPIRNGVLRLHILANSDSDEDQRLKLAVRDRVLTLDLFHPATPLLRKKQNRKPPPRSLKLRKPRRRSFADRAVRMM